MKKNILLLIVKTFILATLITLAVVFWLGVDNNIKALLHYQNMDEDYASDIIPIVKTALTKNIVYAILTTISAVLLLAITVQFALKNFPVLEKCRLFFERLAQKRAERKEQRQKDKKQHDYEKKQQQIKQLQSELDAMDKDE